MCVLSQIKAYYRKYNADRIVQGDILSEVKFRDWDWDTERNNLVVYEKKLPYIAILSQDCDLEQDFKYRTTEVKDNDKILQSILVCPAYGWEDFINGVHLKDYDLQMQKISGTEQKRKIKQQQVPRFHYLEDDSEKQIPALVIDFKHYYTLPVKFLLHIYKEHYAYSLEELFRESLTQRFSFYLSRIGLPEFDKSKESICSNS